MLDKLHAIVGRSLLHRYTVPFLCVGAALTVRLNFAGFFDASDTFPLFFIAVAISAWFAGIKAGLAAIVLCALSVDWFFITPGSLLRFSKLGDWVNGLTFLLVSLGITCLIERLRFLETRSSGETKQLMGEQTKHEEEIQEYLRVEDKQMLLIGELDHRVKNMLSMLHAIAKQTIRRSNSLEEFQEAFEGRLMALAKTHDLLAERNWNRVWLLDLLKLATSAYEDENRPRVTLSSTPIMLTPKAAQALYLVFHELTTNAAKYGALSVSGGHLAVKWMIEERENLRRLFIVWQESEGPSVKEPTKIGFGSQLIERAISFQLEGEVKLEFAESGFCCRLWIPLGEEVALVVPENELGTVAIGRQL